MSEVTSVNGQTGVVILTAPEVGAISDSEAGQPDGVATLNGSSELPEAQLPSSVVSGIPKLVEAGEVEGEYTPNLANGNIFEIVAKGGLTVKLPINTPGTVSYVELLLVQNTAGGHTLALEGYALLGEAPTLSKAANAVNRISVFTINNGSSWYYVGLQAGPKGETGATGAAGAEGFKIGQLSVPSKIKVYKGTGESTTEEREGGYESIPRILVPNNSRTLTSGTPIAARIEVAAKKMIHGFAWMTIGLEAEPASRTHLWIALVNSALEVVARSADYTNHTDTPLEKEGLRGLLFESSYETKALEALYAVICDVVSGGTCLSVATVEGKPIKEAPPMGAATAGGQTTPIAVSSTVALTAITQAPYVVTF